MVATMSMQGMGSISTLYGMQSARNSRPQIPFLTPLGANSGDSAQISDDAIARYDALKKFDAATSISQLGSGRKYKTLAEVAGDLQQNLIDFESQIGGLFDMANIDLSTPVTLQGDGKGHVNVVNDHAQQDAVNQVFAENGPMVSRFMVAAARNAIVQASKNPAFQAAYERDPRAAIRDNIGQLKEDLLGFQMTIGEDGLSTAIA